MRSDEEVEAVRTRVRKGLASAGRPAPAQLHVPRHRSHVARLAAGPEGSIWAVTRRGDDQITIIDRFGADGSFRESYRVNLQVADLAVTSKAIFLLARGELDVAGVAVARWPGADAPSGGS